ncbi:MAG: hypothetical protein II928_05555 [Paludibacteraceae bacterium]|nr:hypothetical protein [Paludibacteraceae bacterium]
MLYRINQVNWPEYSYCPEASVEVSNDHEYLHLCYNVRGEQLRAVTTEDQGPVWEDSCVEFFCQVPGEKHYMNFECNCIGAMVASRRLGRAEDVCPLSAEEMQQIERHCSFPHEQIEERDGVFSWSVELRIPLSLIFRNSAPVFPQELKVNFYKCGDKTKKPHFVSWNPIKLTKPDFHCPQFFGKIVLK